MTWPIMRLPMLSMLSLLLWLPVPGCVDGGGGGGGGPDERAVNDDNTGATETNVATAPCDAGTECALGGECRAYIDGGPTFCQLSDGGLP